MKKRSILLLIVSIFLQQATVAQVRKPAVKTAGKPVVKPAAKPFPKPQPPSAKELAAKDYIAVLADGRQDSILVRWAPSSLVAWQLGNKYGYRLERYTVLRNGKADLEELKKPSLVIENLTPLPKEQWEDIMRIDERAAITSSGIYNEDFKPVSANASLPEMVQIKEQSDAKMGLALFACDLNGVIAKAAGLFYIDKSIKKNERYLYKISLANAEKGKKINPGYTTIAPAQRQVLPKPTLINVEWGNLTAAVTWDVKFDIGLYTAYYLEKSIDSLHYSRVSELPIVCASENNAQTKNAYVDSLADNNSRVYYRLQGLTPFGETGPYSTITGGRGRNDFEILPVIRSGESAEKTKSVTITWTFNGEFINEVKGFNILRAKATEGPYTLINSSLLPVTDTLFTDIDPQPSNYYKVKAISKSGGVALSFPYLVIVSDNEPPAIPAGIKGKIDDSGVVHLQWRQNREKDIMGYKLYRANDLKEEFTEISHDFITRNEYYDTIELQTLTKQIFYKLVAVDQNFNLSKYSEPFELKRPDKVAPAKPHFTDVRMKQGSIHVEWLPSVSDDVVKYLLQRVDKVTGNTKTVLSWNPQRTSVIPSLEDTAAVMGKIYFYYLAASDEAGNTILVRSGEVDYETGMRKAVADFKGVANLQQRTITVSWSYPGKVEQYTLYRCQKGQPMEIYQTLDGTVTQWVEKGLPVGNTYIYKIKAALAGDLQTEISKIVEVKY
jgi:uncharacterized protein